MQTISASSYFCTVKAYCLLTKPGIIFGNLITMIGGFALASQGAIDPILMLATLIALSCIIGSACAFNHYIDREADQKMARTRNRPLVRGDISAVSALVFATLLGVFGVVFFLLFVNPLALFFALIGFLVYVVFYSFFKYRSTHGTLVGSIAGAVPPVIGYCAVSHHVDLAAVILFAIVVTWQMPHFFAIAIYRMQDYRNASIPLLPVKKGIGRTKLEMFLYVAGFILASSLLTFFHYKSWVFLAIALPLGLSWLILAWQGFKAANDVLWARKMFFFSIIMIMAEFAAIALV